MDEEELLQPEPENPFDAEDPESAAPGRGQTATSWYGRSCAKCSQPIHYGYVSEIEGYCGKCTDEVRRLIVESQRADMEKNLIGNNLPARSGGGGGKLVAGLVAGLLIGVVALLAVAAFLPDSFDPLLEKLRSLAGGGG